jgi:CRISPR/Cas system-associated endonuclease Cas1
MLLRNAKTKELGDLELMKELRKKTATAVTREELQGLEGKAAAIYFDNFSSMLHNLEFANLFSGRNRRPPRDPINAMLSLGYSVLSSEISGICETVGLDAACGLLHSPRFGRPALALDLMEEFRPIIVDSVVISIINNSFDDVTIAQRLFFLLNVKCVTECSDSNNFDTRIPVSKFHNKTVPSIEALITYLLSASTAIATTYRRSTGEYCSYASRGRRNDSEHLEYSRRAFCQSVTRETT